MCSVSSFASPCFVRSDLSQLCSHLFPIPSLSLCVFKSSVLFCSVSGCLLCYGSMFPVSVYPCSGSCVGFFMFSFPSLGYCLFSSLFALCITLYFFISALNGSLFLNTQVLVPRSFVSAFWVLFVTPYSLSPPDCDTVVLIQLASFLKKSEDHFQSSRYCMLNSNA